MWHTIYDIIKGIVDEYEHLHMEDLASKEEQGFGVNQENLKLDEPALQGHYLTQQQC